MSWVNARDACTQLNVGYEGAAKAIKRHINGGIEPKFKYRYVEGKGRGGKSLEIWVDGLKPEKLVPKKSITINIGSNQRYLLASEDGQKEALRKASLVRDYLNRPKHITYEDWSKDIDGLPSKGQFLRWVQKYKTGIEGRNVTSLFIDSRGRPKNSFKMSKEQQEMCERYILRRDINPNNVGIYTLMKVAFGDSLPSFATVERYINWYKSKNRMQVTFSKSPEKAKSSLGYAPGKADAKAHYKNHYWELDGTKADIITADGKRHSIIALIDIYSRRVVVTVEEKSTSYAITRNLREGILKLGMPENVITDNGRDYVSAHFQNVCINLKINRQTVAPYSGDKKPHIERFFGTLTRELFRGLEGFCGHNVIERQAIQDRLSFEQKQEAKRKWQQQKYNEDRFVSAVKKEAMQIFVPLNVEELRAYINGWVENVYEQRVHSKIGVSPMQRYVEDRTIPKVVSDKKELDVLLGEWIERTVTKKGIVLKRDGKEAQYTHPKLAGYVGEKVFIALSSDMGTAYVYDEEMAPVCEAKDESLAGFSRELIKSIHKEIKKVQKESTQAIKKAEELALKLGDPSIKDVVEVASCKVKVDSRAKLKLSAKVDIEVPKEEILIDGKPIFGSDFEALVWAIENNREAEFELLIEKQPDIYDIAKRQIEYKKQKEKTA